MKDILICGLINIETTLRIDGFPLDYSPVRYPFFGVNSTVSGVGYNITRALTTLGNGVRLLSLIGQDSAGTLARHALTRAGINDQYVLDNLSQTAQSVILYDGDGRHAIHTDLKDIQQQSYPVALFDEAAADCELTILCNINFSRPFLQRARTTGKTIATDVHTIASLDDDYNADYMQHAHILFMSDEHLPATPENWAREVLNRCPAEIVVIGLGSEGVLLAVRQDNFIERIPAVYTRPVVSTIGAGDALFSAFIHDYNLRGDPYEAIRRAVVFASYKIGTTGAADGFLSQAELDRLYEMSR